MRKLITEAETLGIDLVIKMLAYDPAERLQGIDALLHPYFDELREEGLMFPNGNCLPDVMNFSEFELGDTPEPALLERLIPDWYLEQKGLRR